MQKLVTANRENDMFCSRLVMGLADCINLAGLAKILEKPFKRKLGPLPDTLQAGACVFLPFQNVPAPQFLPTGQYALCFGYSVSGPLTQRSH